MTISVEIRVDVTPISYEAIKAIVANRVIEKARRDRINNFTDGGSGEIFTDIGGKNPNVRATPLNKLSKLSPSNYKVKKTFGHKLWVRKTKSYEADTLRFYFSTPNGDRYTEVNYDFLFRGTPDVQGVKEKVARDSVHNLGCPVGQDRLVSMYCFNSHYDTYRVNPHTITGYGPAFNSKMLGKWFWSADSQFSVFTDTAAWYGRWDQVKIEQKFGDVNYLLFPVIDDIALIAVLGEGITQKTNIDYVCSTTTSGVYAASSQNYVIYAPETLAHNIVDPKVEHLLFRADDTKTVLSAVEAKLCPRQFTQENEQRCDVFDSGWNCTFSIMATRQWENYVKSTGGRYNDNSEKESNGEIPGDWVEARTVVGPLTVRTSPSKEFDTEASWTQQGGATYLSDYDDTNYSGDDFKGCDADFTFGPGARTPGDNDRTTGIGVIHTCGHTWRWAGNNTFYNRVTRWAPSYSNAEPWLVNYQFPPSNRNVNNPDADENDQQPQFAKIDPGEYVFIRIHSLTNGNKGDTWENASHSNTTTDVIKTEAPDRDLQYGGYGGRASLENILNIDLEFATGANYPENDARDDAAQVFSDLIRYNVSGSPYGSQQWQVQSISNGTSVQDARRNTYEGEVRTFVVSNSAIEEIETTSELRSKVLGAIPRFEQIGSTYEIESNLGPNLGVEILGFANYGVQGQNRPLYHPNVLPVRAGYRESAVVALQPGNTIAASLPITSQTYSANQTEGAYVLRDIFTETYRQEAGFVGEERLAGIGGVNINTEGFDRLNDPFFNESANRSYWQTKPLRNYRIDNSGTTPTKNYVFVAWVYHKQVTFGDNVDPQIAIPPPTYKDVLTPNLLDGEYAIPDVGLKYLLTISHCTQKSSFNIVKSLRYQTFNLQNGWNRLEFPFIAVGDDVIRFDHFDGRFLYPLDITIGYYAIIDTELESLKSDGFSSTNRQTINYKNNWNGVGDAFGTRAFVNQRNTSDTVTVGSLPQDYGYSAGSSVLLDDENFNQVSLQDEIFSGFPDNPNTHFTLQARLASDYVGVSTEGGLIEPAKWNMSVYKATNCSFPVNATGGGSGDQDGRCSKFAPPPKASGAYISRGNGQSYKGSADEAADGYKSFHQFLQRASNETYRPGRLNDNGLAGSLGFQRTGEPRYSAGNSNCNDKDIYKDASYRALNSFANTGFGGTGKKGSKARIGSNSSQCSLLPKNKSGAFPNNSFEGADVQAQDTNNEEYCYPSATKDIDNNQRVPITDPNSKDRDLQRFSQAMGSLHKSKYFTSEMLQRGDARALPGLISYSSNGDLELAEHLMNELGYDIANILAVGTGLDDETLLAIEEEASRRNAGEFTPDSVAQTSKDAG